MLSTKDNILTQNAKNPERKLKLRWLVLASTLPLLGIYAAFGIAPQTLTETVQVSTVVETIALPELSNSSDMAVADYWQTDRVRRDDNFATLMKRLHITDERALSFLRSDDQAKQLAAQLKPGRNINAHTTEDGDLLTLDFPLNDGRILQIKRTEDGYESRSTEWATETRQVLKSAVIRSSLFGATDAAGIPDAIAMQIADIFSSQIDFHNDLRKDDRFSVIYEADYHDGELVRTGRVLAVEFMNQGKSFQAIMFNPNSDKAMYYTPDGKSLHKSFLRSPLEFSRVSSGFSLGRFHPILQRMRAHKGVDYAAPTGTRIKAPGDGIVDFAGVKSGYGNVIVLKHPNGVNTVYGHLSRFESGLRRGQHVSQGDVIGYVGMTGLATGPHLHYEFLLNGQHRDPLTVALPLAAPLASEHKQVFAKVSQEMTSQLDLLDHTNLAALD